MSRRRPTSYERELKKRVQHLEAVIDKQRAAWSKEYPGGVHIATEVDVSLSSTNSIKTARLLGHAVVAVQRTSSEILFYALPLPKGTDDE